MITILDTTYREGKQSYLAHKLPDSISDYASILDKIGIEYIQIYHPHISDKNLKQVRSLIKQNPKVKISCHSSINLIEIEQVIDEGITAVDLSIGLTGGKIAHQIDELEKIINHCQNKYKVSLRFRVGLEYATKVPIEALINVCEQLARIAPIVRISISDTDGTATPREIEKTLSKIDEILPDRFSIEIHLHNDTGLAGANLFKAIELFKDSKRELVIDASAGGIGERNGIVSIGDIFSGLYLDQENTNNRKYNIRYYGELYDLCFKDFSFDRDPLNPRAFYQSSGWHIINFLKSGMYQHFDPVMYGQTTRLIFNEVASGDTLQIFAEKILGKKLDKNICKQIAKEMRNYCANNNTCLDEKSAADYISKFIP